VRAVRCARAICSSVEEIGISIRAGVHTGECEVIEGKPGGLAIHIGARVAGQAQSGEVLVSRTVRDLVAGSELRFADRGACQLKGIPEPVELFAVIGSDRARPALDGPAAHMRTMDRALVTIAHRLPGVLRSASKLANRQNVRH
jgi:class 3 adenylate cyclase